MEQKYYESLGERVFHTVLENGLHIYVDPRPDYSKQFAFFCTHYGGMNMRFPPGWPTSWSTRCSTPRTATPCKF